MSETAQRIAKLRTAFRLSPAQLADRINSKEVLVIQWEAGEQSPSIEDFQKLSSFFNVSLDYLVNGIVRDGDEKAINRTPTQEEYIENFERDFFAFLKEHKLDQYYQVLSELLVPRAKVCFAKKQSGYDSKSNRFVNGYWTIDDVLEINDYNLYCVLNNAKYIIDKYNGFSSGGDSHRMLCKHNVTDLRFYTELKFRVDELNEMIADFIDGRREWNDAVILTIIHLGGFVTQASGVAANERDLTREKNVFLTMLLKEYCEKNLKNLV